MQEGIDYEDSFSPVPHAVASRFIMSITAAADMELHCVDLSQAFIQADKIEEGVNGRYFITPPVGYDEEPGVVYEVLRPLPVWRGQFKLGTPSHAVILDEGPRVQDGRIRGVDLDQASGFRLRARDYHVDAH
eukprot:3941377-Rhodomonas_salina.2